MIAVPVSLAADYTMPHFPPLTSHELLPVAPPPGPPIWVCLEFPVPIMWIAGFALMQNKLTRRTFHLGQTIALDSHDCGHMIGHMTLWSSNVKDPIAIMFSSRKMMFSASTVTMEGAPVACTSMAPLLPMLSCGKPISYPGTFAFNASHSVLVGMTVSDLFAGIIAIALTMFCDVFLSKRSRLIGKNKKGWDALLPGARPMSAFVRSLVTDMSRKLFPINAPSAVDHLAKSVLSLATGGVRVVLTGSGKATLLLGSNYSGASVSGEQLRGDKRGANLAVQATGPSGASRRDHEWSHKLDGSDSDKDAAKTSCKAATLRTLRTEEPGKVTVTQYPAYGETPVTTRYTQQPDGSWQQQSAGAPPRRVPNPTWGKALRGTPVAP